MKAAIIHGYGQAVRVEDVQTPELAPDSVLVDVHAASLNPIDNIVIAGHLKDMIPLTFPHVVGYDVSGVVSAVGADVTGVKIGDAVFARPNQDDAGSLAQVARVKVVELALKPDSLSHTEAASIPLAGLTAWQALVDKAGVKAGQKVLIHAGSGGVGTLAIQIAKHLGAHVATTVSARNVDLVTELGADLVIDYKDTDFTDVIRDYDVVFDMLGGDALKKSFGVVRKGGHIVSIKGQDPDGLAAQHGVHFDWFFMEPDGAQLSGLAALLASGVIKPVINRSYPLARAADALAELAEGHAVGKIVVTIV